MVISCINKHRTVLLIVGLTLLLLVTACTPDAVAPVKHKVTYIGFTGDVIEVHETESGNTDTPPVLPEVEGYTFKGWSQEKDGGELYVIETPVTADITLYSVWEKITSYSDTASNLVFSVEDNGELTVKDVIDKEIDGWECIVPGEYRDMKVTAIHDDAFSECSDLKSVEIPSTVKAIGDSAFVWCSSLSVIHAESFDDAEWTSRFGTVYIPPMAMVLLKDGPKDGKIVKDGIAYCLDPVTGELSVCGIAADVMTAEIKESVDDHPVTSIRNSAFYYSTEMTTVTIPGTITSIDAWTFAPCFSLTEIHAESFTKDEWRKISSMAGTPLQSTVHLKDGHKDGKVVEDGIVYFWDSFTGDRYVYGTQDKTLTTASIKSTVEGDPVTSIGDGAFENCIYITEATIPDSVTSIGNRAFDSCNSLMDVSIGANVSTIGNYAFEWCTSLVAVEIPDSVTSMGDYAFEWCESLERLTVGNRLESIGKWAFYGCDSLKDVYAEAFTEEEWGRLSEETGIPEETTIHLKTM